MWAKIHEGEMEYLRLPSSLTGVNQDALLCGATIPAWRVVGNPNRVAE